MLVFLLKSSACLAIFLMFYKLFLENERMHVFKRFYLLAALVLALAIPSITFIQYVEVTPAPATVAPVESSSSEPVITIRNETALSKVNTTEIDYWPVALWTVYGLGVLLFSLKFISNLSRIARNIRNNPKLKIDSIINVLLKDAVVPHTFLNYIFLNRQNFEAREIPKDVMVHEATHARQRHSWDVLFIELLQIVFWFNPLVHLAKKSIKLNHEFLADQAVLDQGVSAPHYQNTLLTFASSANYKDNQPSMANAINYSSYSSIKKRFTVMKTRTSKKGILVRTALLLPLLAISLYGFTETKLVPKKEAVNNSSTLNEKAIKANAKNQISNTDSSGRTVEIAGLVLDSETLLPLENVEILDANGSVITKTDGKGYYKVQFGNVAPGEILFDFSLSKKGYKPMVQREHWGNLQGPITTTYYIGLQQENSESPEFSDLHPNIKDLSYESIQNNLYVVKANFEFNKKISAAKKNNQDVLIQVDHAYYIVNETGLIEINSENDPISINDEKIIPASEVNGLIERKEITGMTPLADNKALYAIYTIPVDNLVRPLGKATQDQLSEYNSLAKKYNAVPKEKRRIPLGDLRKLEHIYGKMTSEQKSNAQPFPECPNPEPSEQQPSETESSKKKSSKPGPSEQEGATKKQIEEYNSLADIYNTMLASEGNIRIKKSDVERLEYLFGIMTEDQRAKAEPFPDFPEPPEPPAPPAMPKSPDVSDKEFAEEIIQEIIAHQDPYDGNFYLRSSDDSRTKPFYSVSKPSPFRNTQEIAKRIEKEMQPTKLEQSVALPPTPPTMAVHANTDNYSKELKKAIDTYLTERSKYDDAVTLYSEEHKGSVEDLRIMYNGVMGLYHNYAALAHKEDKFIPPVPFRAARNLKSRSSHTPIPLPTPPAPQTPPKPKSPLELLEELKKDNAKIILDGKKINYEEAEKFFTENTFSRVDVRKEKGGRPVLEVWTE